MQRRQRELLATFLLYANEPLSSDMLMDALWGPQMPRAASGALRTYVWAVRRLLAPSARLRTRPWGYLFEVAPGELDLKIFDRLFCEARGCLERGDVAIAADQLRRGLALWRHPSLPDVPLTTSMAGRTELVRAQHQAAQELLIDIELRLGRHQQLIPQLRALISEHPSQERYWSQLMLALYRSGRRTEALAAYSQAHTALTEEFGIEPGAELKRLQQEVLSEEPELDIIPCASQARIADRTSLPALPPRQIPPEPMDFVGRTVESDELVALLATPEASVPIIVICGRAGVGKTSLALHVAHALHAHFHDGQLYVELEGSSGRPRGTHDALDHMLRSLDLLAPTIPDSVAGRAALLRSLLAGKRVLVVVDDASEAEQVMPLLPGTGGCAVLITSRARLTGLPGARLIHLEGFSVGDSLALLEYIVGRERIEADPESANFIVEACDHLPLAVRIAGARLQTHRNWPLRRLANSITETGRRFEELSTGRLSVREGLASTYAALSKEEQRLFRLLALPAAYDIPEWALAILHNRPGIRQVLDGLVDRHILNSVGVDTIDQPRYRLDSLTMEYARGLLIEVPAAERQSALERVLAGWTHLAHLAGRRMARDPYYSVPEIGTDPVGMPADVIRSVLAHPVKWFLVEHANLQTIGEQACEEGKYATAAQLAAHQFALHYFQRNTDDISRIWRNIAAAATAAGDVSLAAEADVRIGILRAELGEDFVSLRLFEHSLSVFETEGYSANLALSLSCVAYGRHRQQRYVTALHAATCGLDMARKVGDIYSEYLSFSVLGAVVIGTGDHIEGLALCHRALDIARKLDRTSCELFAILNLAESNILLARYETAIELSCRGLALASELGHGIGEAYFLAILAAAYCGVGRYTNAIDMLARAREIFAKHQAIRQEAVCVLRLVSCYQAIGCWAPAANHLEEAFCILQALRLPYDSELAKRASPMKIL